MIRLIANHEKIKINDFYDMIFTLSVTLDNWKYVDRFVFLLDNGLSNIGNKKIAIISLLGNETVPLSMFTICQNRNIDFYFVSNDMPFPSNSSKLASFFVKYEKINCKYLVKIDEDSLTDVSD